jgi:DNA-binding FadR family transcriptional regulator
MFAAIERCDAAGAGELMTAHLREVDSYWQQLIEQDDAPMAQPADAEG